MGLECGECERDMRGGHAEDCSRRRLGVYYDGQCDFYVAWSAEDAEEQQRAAHTHCGLVDSDDVVDAENWERWPDEKTLSVGDGEAGSAVARTCAEWVETRGRGLLCSTER